MQSGAVGAEEIPMGGLNNTECAVIPELRVGVVDVV